MGAVRRDATQSVRESRAHVNISPYFHQLGLKREATETTMSQPSQEHPMAPNSVESTETGPLSVQETLTTEGGDGNSEPGEDLQVHHS